ncbi:hypothetical protein B1H18_03980 [Streptomyces tsukubensis]|uniref:Uncharacterized protein n=1 Tax=Streptomyces tsukubensis TaxID=83656 RepID=A0A1V4AF58_9ACTN|nr:hypothetical protein B1H18_03980 [Streptomyces tsukubensis]
MRAGLRVTARPRVDGAGPVACAAPFTRLFVAAGPCHGLTAGADLTHQGFQSLKDHGNEPSLRPRARPFLR